MKHALFLGIALAALPSFADVGTETPPVQTVKLTIGAEKIEEIVYLPENGGGTPFKLAVISQPAMKFSAPVKVKGEFVESLPIGNYPVTLAQTCAAFGFGSFEQATGLTHFLSAANKTMYYARYDTKEWKTQVGSATDQIVDVLTCKVAKD